MFVDLCRLDLAGRQFGRGSAEYLAALSLADLTFGRLVDVLGDEAQIVVTADHGGHDTSDGTPVEDVIETFIAVRSRRVPPGSVWAEASVLDVAPTVADLAGLAPIRAGTATA